MNAVKYYNQVKYYRELKKITQEDSARKIGVSLSYFQKVEYGLSIPSVYIAIKLSRLYNVGIELLFPCD